MKTPVFLVACCAVLIPVVPGVAGEKPDIEFPSPDGRYAFRETFDSVRVTLDLVEKASGKPVCRVLDSGDSGPRLQGDILWSPDSKRFALSGSEARLSWSVSVFVQDGGAFREAELPTLTDPEIPSKYEKDDRLFHWSEIGVWRPVR